ncbi:MAG TPA: hypothetical protein DD621_05380 [Clostridiales bacterium]|nr:hypothetical protein [Clostridiales bacterium]
MEVVDEVLKKIGAKAPVLTVFNKIDLVPDFEDDEFKSKNVVYISAKNNTNVEQLKQSIIKLVNKNS